MADTEHARAAVGRAQPGGERIERRAAVAHDGLVERSFGERAPAPSLAENRGAVPIPSIWPRASSRQASTCGPPVDAELEARRAGIEHDCVVVHSRHSDQADTALCSDCRRACAASIATRAARDARSHAVGAARQDDRHARAEHEPGAVGVRQKAELLGEHVARLEVWHEQDVGIAGDLRLDALHPRGLFADGVVERQRAIEHAAGDLPALGHLAQRGGVERGLHLGVDGLDGGENGNLRSGHAERDRQIDRVLADVRPCPPGSARC